MDVSEQLNDMQNVFTRLRRDSPTTIDTTFSCSSGRDDGNIMDTVSFAVDNKQERRRGSEAGSVKAIPGNSNVASSEEQLREVDGRSRYTNVDADSARVQSKGPNYYSPQEHFERSTNRRFGEEHEFANHSKTPMVGEYQRTEPTPDSLRLKSSLGDSIRHGDLSRSRNFSDESLAHPSLDQRGSLGPSGEFKTNSSHRNFLSKTSSDDETATFISGRVATEESKTTYNDGVIHQKDPTFPGDNSYQGHNQDRGSHTMSQSLLYSNLAPHVQLLPYVHPVQMHLAVPSAIPIPVLGLAGPPSASSFRAIHLSSPSGDSALNRATSHPPMQISCMPSTFSATPAYTISVGTLGDSAGSHIGGFSFHAEEQLEQRRSPLEDQAQPLQRVSVSPNASPFRSVFIGNPPVSIGSAIPFIGASPELPQVSGKSNAASRGRGCAVEMAGLQMHSPVNESPSVSSLGDEGQRAASCKMGERTEYLEPRLKNRESISNSSNVKASAGKSLKDTNGNKQVYRKARSHNDKCEMEVVRSVDGNAADLPLQCFSQGNLEDACIGSSQAPRAHLPPFTSAHSYEETVPMAVPNYHRSSSVHSVTLEPAGMASHQSLQAPNNQGGSGTESTSSSTLERVAVTPVSVGVSCSTGSYPPPISEFASVSIGPSFRKCPTGTVLMPMTSPQPMYYSRSLCYSPFLILPAGTDGVVRVDSVGSLHSNCSMDFATNTLRFQSSEDSRTRTMPQVGVDIAERPTGVGNRKHMETPHVESTSEKGIPGDLQDDILRGDLPTHEKQLRRSMQYSNADFSGSNSAMKFQQVPQLWEGSTRFHGNLDLHAGPNIPYPFGLTMPLYPSHERMAEGLHTPRSFPVHDSVCTLPKSRNGTGTYIPKPRHAYTSRERVGSGARGGNQHGAHSQQDRKDREGVNQSHTSRYRSLGQGRGQHNKHEPRAQYMVNPQKSPASDPERNINSVQQTMDRRGSPPPSPISAPANQTTSAGSYTANSNGHPRTGTRAPAVILQHNLNDASTVLPYELEFGSLGPV